MTRNTTLARPISTKYGTDPVEKWEEGTEVTVIEEATPDYRYVRAILPDSMTYTLYAEDVR